MPVPLRPSVADLPAYKAGRPAPERADAGSERVTYKLSSNENPFPPLPGVLEAVAAASASMNRYPDIANAVMTEALAARGVDAVDVEGGPERGEAGGVDAAVRGEVVGALAVQRDPDVDELLAVRARDAAQDDVLVGVSAHAAASHQAPAFSSRRVRCST